MKNNFRFYYDKSLEYLYNEELRYLNAYSAKNRAKYRLRMYANLFLRDLRKNNILQIECCKICNTNKYLQLDHIIPISKGGKNCIDNIQVLCNKCNRLKSDKII